MLKSEAERVVRRALEETKAEFTEEQIQALSLICTKIASQIVEEAFANNRTGQQKGRFFE
jgi:ribosomal protein S7